MIDKNRTYTLEELLKLYNMYNLEFKFYGNNKNGNLELFMKTDTNKVSVFKSINEDMTKYDYLKLNEEEARKIKYKYEREVDNLELDIATIVLRTSDANIPSGRYSLEKIDYLTKQQDQEDRKISNNLVDGISYIIVDNNSACTLYDGVYVFNKNNNGFIDNLKKEFDEEKDEVRKNNLNIILDYYDKHLDNVRTI